MIAAFRAGGWPASQGLMPLTSYLTLKVDRRDCIAIVVVNRPQKLNALDRATVLELGLAFEALGLDPEVRGIVLTGEGSKAFVAGADIEELSSLGAQEGRELARRGQGVFAAIEALDKPVIAAVNGFALGGGLELALSCHLRIASENARFGSPEVKLGLMCGYGGTQRLPRLIGRGRALEMLLTGDMIDAAEARRVGLVNLVVPQESLVAEAEALLKRIVSNAPLSLKATLEAVCAGLEMPLHEGELHEAALFGLLCGTSDMREGMRAFLEKRAARFQGK